MSVYFKFKSAKDFDSVPIEGHFITVCNLKVKIFESKQLGRGTDYDLAVINAQTNEEYFDEAALIPKNTSVLIRRLPGQPQMPIVTAPVTAQDEKMVENKHESVPETSVLGADRSVMKNADDFQEDEFGKNLYNIPPPVISSNPVQDAPPPTKSDEDRRIRALVNTPALDWSQRFVGLGRGRGFGRGMAGRGFDRGWLEWRMPPEGYICYRCHIPGHFIQDCPTNGDPNFDIKWIKPPTGIPNSMLMPAQDGSYTLSNGNVVVMKPNVSDVFEKEIAAMPTTRRVGELPPELHCPLCKEVMKDAVLTGKCCHRSFCDKCIRDQIISKAKCACGTTDILADNLLPNNTLRDTIRRILETNNASPNNHARGEEFAPPANLEAAETQGGAKQDKEKVLEVAGSSEKAHEDQEGQNKQVPAKAEKKKKKKKVNFPTNAAEMQWTSPPEFTFEPFMPPPGPFYNPYWSVMPPVMEPYMGGPYGDPMPPFMGYGTAPPGMMPPFVPPYRDPVEFGMYRSDGPPIMNRDEFEARKAGLRRKRELEIGGQRELPKDRESHMEISSNIDISSKKLKTVKQCIQATFSGQSPSSKSVY